MPDTQKNKMILMVSYSSLQQPLGSYCDLLSLCVCRSLLDFQQTKNLSQRIHREDTQVNTKTERQDFKWEASVFVVFLFVCLFFAKTQQSQITPNSRYTNVEIRKFFLNVPPTVLMIELIFLTIVSQTFQKQKLKLYNVPI